MKLSLTIEFLSIPELQEFLQGHNQVSSVLDEYRLEAPSKDPTRKNKKWTSIEINFIRDHYNKFSARDIAKSLHRTPVSVTAQVQKMVKLGDTKLRKNNRAKNL